MKLKQTTIDLIKSYIIQTQSNSTYNYAPHEPLEMCYYDRTAYNWNMCNSYKYINRNLAVNGEKKANIQDLLKVCHYCYFEWVRECTTSFNAFKEKLLNSDSIDTLIGGYNLESFPKDLKYLIDLFKSDKKQVTGEWWFFLDYFKLASYLIDNCDDIEIANVSSSILLKERQICLNVSYGGWCLSDELEAKFGDCQTIEERMNPELVKAIEALQPHECDGKTVKTFSCTDSDLKRAVITDYDGSESLIIRLA